MNLNYLQVVMKKPEISETIDEMHERFLIEALKRSNGHRKKAADMLGISERTVYHKMVKYGMPIKEKRG